MQKMLAKRIFGIDAAAPPRTIAAFYWAGLAKSPRPISSLYTIPQTVQAVLQQLVLLERLGRLNKHIRLRVGVLNALTGYVEILGFEFNSDELTPHLGARNAGCSAAHEGV